MTASDYIALPEYKGISISSEVLTASEDDLNSQIDSILSNYVTYEQIKDRAVADGDTLNIDYVGKVDGVEFEGGSTDGAEMCIRDSFSPASGTLVDSGSSVAITCATEGVTIYYTTDGSTPTHDSRVYREPIAISGDTTIKAIAVKAGMADSVVATAEYTLKTNAAVPVITGQPVSASYVQHAKASVLTVETSVSDGGMLSYQWYSNTKNAVEGGTPCLLYTSRCV